VGATDVFGAGEKEHQAVEEEVQELHAKIGKLTMERNLSAKRSVSRPAWAQADDHKIQYGLRDLKMQSAVYRAQHRLLQTCKNRAFQTGACAETQD
jgi:hypothetical protein